MAKELFSGLHSEANRSQIPTEDHENVRHPFGIRKRPDFKNRKDGEMSGIKTR
jgi:hypothetical protein